jgi:ABC-2 type transport system ATP-binding protein
MTERGTLSIPARAVRRDRAEGAAPVASGPSILPARPVSFADPSAMDRPPAARAPVISIEGLTKTYASGHAALRRIDLEIRRGEIFALLGPNGAGKTTLISIVCGIVTPTSGTVRVDGHEIVRDYRAARGRIGLVPQELHTDMFESVLSTVAFSRGLFGLAPDPAHLERVLRDLSLWDKRNDRIMTLSGGMKRRVLIAKALAHEPRVLFLDEPTAGVDVELRRDMWALVRRLRDGGVTILLTTHYIEEAEEMADRIGVIHRGELVVVEDKHALMRKLGRKQLTLSLQEPMRAVPAELAAWNLALNRDGTELEYTFEVAEEHAAIPALLRRIGELGIGYKDLNTRQSSLEEIFVGLVNGRA